MFCNGIFNGRYFIWIDFPLAFMTVDVLDFTSFGCVEEEVAPVFGHSLSSMVEQFSAYASKLRIDEERDYRLEVAALYDAQWALAHPYFREDT